MCLPLKLWCHCHLHWAGSHLLKFHMSKPPACMIAPSCWLNSPAHHPYLHGIVRGRIVTFIGGQSTAPTPFRTLAACVHTPHLQRILTPKLPTLRAWQLQSSGQQHSCSIECSTWPACAPGPSLPRIQLEVVAPGNCWISAKDHGVCAASKSSQSACCPSCILLAACVQQGVTKQVGSKLPITPRLRMCAWSVFHLTYLGWPHVAKQVTQQASCTYRDITANILLRSVRHCALRQWVVWTGLWPTDFGVRALLTLWYTCPVA